MRETGEWNHITSHMDSCHVIVWRTRAWIKSEPGHPSNSPLLSLPHSKSRIQLGSPKYLYFHPVVYHNASTNAHIWVYESKDRRVYYTPFSFSLSLSFSLFVLTTPLLPICFTLPLSSLSQSIFLILSLPLPLSLFSLYKGIIQSLDVVGLPLEVRQAGWYKPDESYFMK